MLRSLVWNEYHDYIMCVFFEDIFLFFFLSLSPGRSPFSPPHTPGPTYDYGYYRCAVHTHTRSSLNVEGDDSNQNQAVFSSFLSSAHGLFFVGSHMALAWLPSVCVCLPCSVLLFFLLLLLAATTEKREKKNWLPVWNSFSTTFTSSRA